MTTTQAASVLMRVAAIVALLSGAACAHRAPTIAHVHIGHAITGAHDTPDREGYFSLAESRAERALAEAQAAIEGEPTIDEIKRHVAAANTQTNTVEPYPLTGAVAEAANHLEYAALSLDASANLKAGYQRFAGNIEGVLTRGTLIENYARDVAAAGSRAEADTLAREIHRLARANVFGEDRDGDGMVGNDPAEYGVVQIRRDLDALVAREDPPYVTVDRWYLFNLIRLPSGEWIFRRGGSRGSGGYQ